ncbi:hypothetical protein ACP26L_12760 [Paenibacillus sp. S-38]|uniref:hypothetical protein n=1 Tax=Paenibacillus sp. S-38 TaxID=3416710 RepID=UPI003CECB950
MSERLIIYEEPSEGLCRSCRRHFPLSRLPQRNEAYVRPKLSVPPVRGMRPGHWLLPMPIPPDSSKLPPAGKQRMRWSS